MRSTHKLTALLLAAAMVFSLGGGALAADSTDADYDGKVVILHTNDTHGRVAYSAENGIIGFDGVAALRDYYESLGADVLLMDAGDATQGQPVVNVYEGQNVIEFMNAAGYDVAAVGNHEFDFSFDNLLAMAENADFPLVAANLTYRDGGDLVLEDNTVLTAGDVTVGVFGLATPETMTKANPVNTAEVSFGADAEELYDIAQAQVDALEAEGCDIIVCLGHLGTDAASEPYRSTDVIENVEGIDLFIDGHSHTTLESGETVGDTLLVSTGEYFANVGCVVYDPADGSMEASLISAEDAANITPDAEITAMIEEYQAEVDAEYGEVFATTEVDLNGTREGGDAVGADNQVIASFPAGEGNRTAETNMGDFAADAILWQAQQIDDGTVAAITNGGGIRETIPAGEITKNALITVYPFGNQVTILELTGAQLLEALEAATYCTPQAVGAFPQVSGIEFTIDTTVPYENGELYPDSTYYAPAAPGSRVTITSVGGEKFDPEAVYTIATNDYSAAGGDTYYVFTQASYKYDTGIALEDALINYTTEVLGGVIGEEYAEPQGRITIIESPLSAYTDLDASAWYAQSVGYSLDNGYMVGLSDTAFAPDDDMTRVQYMTLLYRIGEAAGVYDEAVTTGDNWSVPGTALAVDYGFSWTEEELSRPITRYELTMAADRLLSDLYDGAELAAIRESVEFTDLSGEQAAAIEELYCAGLINGYEDGSFQPDGTARRCEVATIVYNMLEVVTTAGAEDAAA